MYNDERKEEVREIRCLQKAIATRLARQSWRKSDNEYRIGYDLLLSGSRRAEIERLRGRIEALDTPSRTTQGKRIVLQCPNCQALWYEDGNDLLHCDDDCPTQTHPLEGKAEARKEVESRKASSHPNRRGGARTRAGGLRHPGTQAREEVSDEPTT